jgi:hypothetical protein
MADMLKNGDQEIVASKLPANNRLPGDNGYQGPSSVVPGDVKPGTSEFAPPKSEAHRIIEDAGMAFDQTRKIDPTAVRTTFGHRDRNGESAAAKVPSNGRPVTTAGNHPTAPFKTGKHN